MIELSTKPTTKGLGCEAGWADSLKSLMKAQALKEQPADVKSLRENSKVRFSPLTVINDEFRNEVRSFENAE